MESFRIKCAIACCALMLVAACSNNKNSNNGSSNNNNGGNTVSSMTITYTDPSGTAKSFAANDSNAVMQSVANTTEGQTVIQMCGNIDTNNDCSQLMIMTVNGAAAGTYSIKAGDTSSQIVYHDDESGTAYHYESSTGAITLTSVGAAGEPVQGVFSAVLECSSGCTGTTNASGTFSVVLSQ